ncbi:hypothetical protein [[Kitasatospora] papulosa]|uniref:hypothetical protein n=1 Tax=[Kitasatospora] papulosa TaxID=1464011 RepID=UPI0036A08752
MRSSSHEWRARTPRRVMVDTRSIEVGLVVRETCGTVTLRPVNAGSERDWDVPAATTRPATPDEVAAALTAE